MKHLRTLAPVLAILFCSLLFPFLVGDPTLSSTSVEVLIVTGVAAAWNIFSGYTGYISLGHATFYGLGAYSFALAVQDWHLAGGFGSFLLLPLAGLVAGAFSVPLGWIALHARRHTFMVITIAIFFIFQLLAYNLSDLTGGAPGIFLPIPGWSADLYNTPFYFAALSLLLLVVFASLLTRWSRFGLVLLAIRDDEDRVRGLGIRPGRYKLGSYVLSASLTGMFGALAIFFTGFITPSTGFDQTLDITLVAITFLGGIGYVAGPLVGGLLLVPLQAYLSQQFSANVPGLNQALLGGFLLLVILFLPRGIVPTMHERSSRKGVSQTGEGAHQAAPAPASFPLQPQTPVSVATSAGFPDPLVALSEQHPVVPRADYHAPVIPHPAQSRPSTQRLRALRLESVSPKVPLSPAEPVAPTPVVSWRCPRCGKPFLLQGNICYCPRCGITRSLTYQDHPASPVLFSPFQQG